MQAHAPRIKLRTSAFDEWAEQRWPGASDRALADKLGEHYTSLSQYRSGRRSCGAAFIAKVLTLAGPSRFNALFEIERAKVGAR